MKATARERTFRIGRARDCDVVLADDSVSRYHAELSFIEGGRLFLTDCRSINGTALVSNNRETRVRQTLLSPTETIRFGDVVLPVKELLEAIRLKFPAFAGAVAPELPSKPKTQPWLRGDRLVRCTCGAVKRKHETCPTCGE